MRISTEGFRYLASIINSFFSQLETSFINADFSNFNLSCLYSRSPVIALSTRNSMLDILCKCCKTFLVYSAVLASSASDTPSTYTFPSDMLDIPSSKDQLNVDNISKRTEKSTGKGVEDSSHYISIPIEKIQALTARSSSFLSAVGRIQDPNQCFDTIMHSYMAIYSERRPIFTDQSQFKDTVMTHARYVPSIMGLYSTKIIEEDFSLSIRPDTSITKSITTPSLMTNVPNFVEDHDDLLPCDPE